MGREGRRGNRVGGRQGEWEKQRGKGDAEREEGGDREGRKGEMGEGGRQRAETGREKVWDTSGTGITWAYFGR